MTTQGPARYVTTTVLPNSPTYDNGTDGVGATLTDSGMNVLTIDGEDPDLYARVLVKDQSDDTQNGLYFVSTLGVSGTTAWVLTRATDFDTPDKINTHDPIAVVGNPTYAEYNFYCTSTVDTIGTDSITFDIYSAAQSLSDGHVLVGNSSDIATDVAMSGDITIDNTGATSISSDVNLPGSPTTTTQTARDDSTRIATTAYVDAEATDAGLAFSDITTNNVTSMQHGFAPKSPGDATTFLNGAATPDYAQVKDSDLSLSDITTNNVSTSEHGFAPKLPNDATKYLDGTGSYSVPTGSGIFTNSYTSSDQTITSAGSLTLAHSLGTTPTLVMVSLVCQTTEGGYSAGDITPISPTENNNANNTQRGLSIVVDSTNLNVRFGSDSACFILLNKSTGHAFTITNSYWKVRFSAWA